MKSQFRTMQKTQFSKNYELLEKVRIYLEQSKRFLLNILARF